MIIASFVSFCQFFSKCFTQPALGSCLFLTGNKFITSGCILQNSDRDRKSVTEGIINLFLLYSSSSEHSSPLLPPPIFLFPNRWLFPKGLPSISLLGFLIIYRTKEFFWYIFKLRDLTTSSSYLDPKSIFSASENAAALSFSMDSALFLSPTTGIRTLRRLMQKQEFTACPGSRGSFLSSST